VLVLGACLRAPDEEGGGPALALRVLRHSAHLRLWPEGEALEGLAAELARRGDCAAALQLAEAAERCKGPAGLAVGLTDAARADVVAACASANTASVKPAAWKRLMILESDRSASTT